MNETIVKLIKKARIERNKTQQDLADHLGKTAASISDLERGKVQVSASDLYKISLFLHKPIEYFFGEEYTGKEAQDLISILRRQSPKYRNESIEYMTILVKLQELGAEIEANPDIEITEDILKRFFELYIPLVNLSKNANSQVTELNQKLVEEVKIKEFDLSDYLSQLDI